MATLGLNVCHRGDDQQIDKIGSGDRRGRCHSPGNACHFNGSVSLDPTIIQYQVGDIAQMLS